MPGDFENLVSETRGYACDLIACFWASSDLCFKQPEQQDLPLQLRRFVTKKLAIGYLVTTLATVAITEPSSEHARNAWRSS